MGENQRNKDIFTQAPPLSPEDERLVTAYREFGVPVDQLIVTGTIHQLCRQLKGQGEDRTAEELMKRLLNLRKAGRLPRFSMPSPIPRHSQQLTIPSNSLIETVSSLHRQGVHSMTLDVEADGTITLTYLPAAG